MILGGEGVRREKAFRIAEESLGRQVSAATKAGRHWGRDGAIALCRRRLDALEELGEEARGQSAFASTYYAAAHLAASRIRLHPSAPIWGVLFLWDLTRARYWIERHEKAAGGIKRMSAGALDIYAAIATMRGDLWGHVSHSRADACYRAAIHAAVAVAGCGKLSDDDYALNLVRRVGLLMRTETGSGGQTDSALDLITEAFTMVPRLAPLTAVRVMRQFGEFLGETGKFAEAELHLTTARALAKQEGLADQVAKITPLLARVWKKRLGRTSWF